MAHQFVKDNLESDEAAINGQRVRLPQWLAVLLVTQLCGGVWWAATQSANAQHERESRQELAVRVEEYRLEIAALSRQIATLQGTLNERRRGE